MLYQAYIREVSYEWYEGTLCLEIEGSLFTAAYTVSHDEFVQEHLEVGTQITVDLWLRYCSEIKLLPPNAPQQFPYSQKIAGGNIQGRVTSIIDDNVFRVDCGTMIIDVKNESDVFPDVGQMIRAIGTYHVFFPETECSREALDLM